MAYHASDFKQSSFTRPYLDRAASSISGFNFKTRHVFYI